MLLLLYGLIVFMIISAIIAIETYDLLSSVISMGAMGLALAIIFLILGAPDLAIVQVVVESLFLVILISFFAVKHDTTVDHQYRYPAAFATAVGLIFFGIFIMFAAIVFKEMPEFGSPLFGVSQQYLDEGFKISNAANLVTAILLDFRAYDTLGEATVIFVSIIGAFVILRKKGKIKDAGNDTDR